MQQQQHQQQTNKDNSLRAYGRSLVSTLIVKSHSDLIAMMKVNSF